MESFFPNPSPTENTSPIHFDFNEFENNKNHEEPIYFENISHLEAA